MSEGLGLKRGRFHSGPFLLPQAREMGHLSNKRSSIRRMRVCGIYAILLIGPPVVRGLAILNKPACLGGTVAIEPRNVLEGAICKRQRVSWRRLC